jgi:hypothetical protein
LPATVRARVLDDGFKTEEVSVRALTAQLMDYQRPPTSPLCKAASEPDLAAHIDSRIADSDGVLAETFPYEPLAGAASGSQSIGVPDGGTVRGGITGFVGDQHSLLEHFAADTGATPVSFGEYMQAESSWIHPVQFARQDGGEFLADGTFNAVYALRDVHPSESQPCVSDDVDDQFRSAQSAFGMSLSLPPLCEPSARLGNISELKPPASHQREKPLESARRMVPPIPGVDFSPRAFSTTVPAAVEGYIENALPRGVSSGEVQSSMMADEKYVGQEASKWDTDIGKGGGLHESEETGYAARRYKLRCLEMSATGTVTERKLSRTEIMQAARETLPKNVPSPKAIARWLGSAQEDSKELLEFKARYGTGKETSHKAMQKALRNYLRNSLQPRDIRQVDPAFSAKPALWVRHSALVVSLEGVRAIVLHDKVFLFDPDHAVAKAAVAVIQQSVMTSPDLLDDPDMPFEFRALEGIFIVGIVGLEREFNQLNPEVESHLHELPTQLTSKMLEELRIKKQRLNQFLSRAHSVRDILEKLLDEDEDMANMYLSEKHRSPHISRDVGDHDQVEMLLEAYMQVIDELVNRADLLNDAIDDTEDLVMIHLDTLRNKLLSVDLALSVFSMTFGFGGLMSGVFGMNLPIPLFTSAGSKYWFLGVVSVIAAFIVIVSWLMLLHLRRRGLYTFR